MRIRSFLAATAAVGMAVGAVAVATTSTPVRPRPAGCRANSNGIVEFCDHFDPFVRGRGAIGLLGDSVLLGSSPGMSTPSLPTMLAGQRVGARSVRPPRWACGRSSAAPHNATLRRSTGWADGRPTGSTPVSSP